MGPPRLSLTGWSLCQIVVQVEVSKVCETIEDSLCHVVQLISGQIKRLAVTGQIERLAVTHTVENAISQCLDTLVVEVLDFRVFLTRACAVQDSVPCPSSKMSVFYILEELN